MSGFLRLFHALHDADIRYVAVGGVAVVLHGHVRATADVDLVLDFSAPELARAMGLLQRLGYRPLLPVEASGFADPEQRRLWVEQKGMLVFSLTHPDPAWPGVDVFVHEPFPFEEMWEASRLMNAGGVLVRVCSLPQLLAMKRAAGRAQDQADIEALAPETGHEQ